MSSAVKTVFGGTDDSAQKAQTRANARAEELIATQSARARRNALALYPASDVNRNLGFQAALDVMGDYVPEQLSTLQQGNVGAQEALLASMPQVQNALMGMPVDYSGLQAQQIGFDPSFLSQSLPDFKGSRKAINQEFRRSQANQPRASALLGGINRGAASGIRANPLAGRRRGGRR